MDEIIKLLKEKGFVDKLQHSLDATTAITGEFLEDGSLEASKYCLREFIKRHKNVMEKFSEFAVDSALEAIIKALDLKPNKDYKPDGLEKLIALMAGVEVLKNKEDK